MFPQIDHIGIAVRNMKQSFKIYTESYGLSCALIETHEDLKTNIAFVPVGEVTLELLEPMSAEAPISKFIQEKGEGIHHIAYRVKDIVEAVAELKKKGMKIMREPRPGGGGSVVAFLSPESTQGVLTELVEK